MLQNFQPAAIVKMNSDGTDPVLLRTFETGIEYHPVWWGTPQQHESAERATDDQHTQQAIKDWRTYWRPLQEPELQAYKDQMNKLLREKNLRESEDDSQVRRLAQERTLHVLRRLDAGGKQ